MLDEDHDQAREYAWIKLMELDAEIKILTHSAENGVPLSTIRKYAKRMAVLEGRRKEFSRKKHYTITSYRTDGTSMALERIAAWFDATEGRQMLDKWDAEDAAMQETTNA